MNREYAILPHNGTAYLYALANMELTPLVPAPGLPDARYFMAEDHTTFAFIDQLQKRVGFYQILAEPPYVETLISPTTLPKNCHADALVIHQNCLYVGGRSKRSESLWKHKPGNSSWQTIPLPENFAYLKGKSMDALFTFNNQLIAVDDMIFPKWILVYDISNFEAINFLNVFPLAQHGTYETVRFGADNDKYIALFSSSMGMGGGSQFVSLLHKNTLEEICYWGIANFFGRSCVRSELHRSPYALPRPNIQKMIFFGDYLLVSTKSKLHKVRLDIASLSNQRPSFMPVHLQKVRVIETIIKSKHNQQSILVVGYDKNAMPTSEWVNIPD